MNESFKKTPASVLFSVAKVLRYIKIWCARGVRCKICFGCSQNFSPQARVKNIPCYSKITNPLR